MGVQRAEFVPGQVVPGGEAQRGVGRVPAPSQVVARVSSWTGVQDRPDSGSVRTFSTSRSTSR